VEEQERRAKLNRLMERLSKRGRALVEHILEHGRVTTEELETQYGLSHPPRAARDVREAGIPLKTSRTRSSDGRSIAVYELGDLAEVRRDRFGGRRILPKALRDTLYYRQEGKCAICSGSFEARYLQIDHRVPYEVAGEGSSSDWNADDYMLICGPDNRAKSWSCEHCRNWLEIKSPALCLTCYWGNPEDYEHVALEEVRRAAIQWDGKTEVGEYEQLAATAQDESASVSEYIKRILSEHLRLSGDDKA
jgi:hypothetical protein